MKIEYEYDITVKDLLADFKKKYGSIENLRKKVGRTKRVTQAYADLTEWEHYRSARGHKHGPDEQIHAGEAIFFHDPAEFFRYVTPERVRILDALRSGEDFGSINELARSLGRDPKNVFDDIAALEKRGLVGVDRRNRRRSVPRARVRRVVATI